MSDLSSFLIQSMAILGGLGLAVGIMLIVASKKFKVETNPLVDVLTLRNVWSMRMLPSMVVL